MQEGEIFKVFADRMKANKVELAKAMNISKQSLFQIFSSRTLKPETIEKIVRATGYPWEQIQKIAAEGQHFVSITPIKNPGELPGSEILQAKDEIIRLQGQIIAMQGAEKEALQKTVSDFSGKISALTSEVEELKDLIHGFAKFFDPDEASGAGLDWTKKGRKTGRSGHNA